MGRVRKAMYSDAVCISMCGMSSVRVVNGRLWRKRNRMSYEKCHGRETETTAGKE